MHHNHHDDNRQNQNLPSELRPNRNRNSDTKVRNAEDPKKDSKINRNQIDANNPYIPAMNESSIRIHNLNPENAKEKLTQDFNDFCEKYLNFLLHKEIFFWDCWDKGNRILDRKIQSHEVYRLYDITGSKLLCMLNYSPENFERYENEIPFILKHVSVDVCIWYFFEISKYFFQFFSNIKFDESEQSKEAKNRFNLVWTYGNFLLNSEVVQKKTVKSDVAEQLLLILDSSDPELLKIMKIDIKKEIIKISKYVIQEDIDTLKMTEYGFSFKKEQFDNSKIHLPFIKDNSQENIKKCYIKNLSVSYGFKIFNLGNLLSLFFLLFAAILFVF